MRIRKISPDIKLLTVQKVLPISTIRHLQTRRELVPKRIQQLFLGSLIGTRRSEEKEEVVPVTVPEVFAKVNLTQVSSRF